MPHWPCHLRATKQGHLLSVCAGYQRCLSLESRLRAEPGMDMDAGQGVGVCVCTLSFANFVLSYLPAVINAY